MKLNKKAIENGNIQTILLDCPYKGLRQFEVRMSIEGYYLITNLKTKKIIGSYSSYSLMRRVLSDLIKR